MAELWQGTESPIPGALAMGVGGARAVPDYGDGDVGRGGEDQKLCPSCGAVALLS